MFTQGQTVTCIHKGGSTDPLTVGRSYEVVNINSIKVVGGVGSYEVITIKDLASNNLYGTYANCIPWKFSA
jgi:hypothetical protein